MPPFKPMLAATIDVKSNLDDQLDRHYPLVASAKVDGIRVIVHPDLGPVTRKLKPVPNLYVRELLRPYVGLDGEAIIGSPVDPHVFNRSQSGIMSEEGKPDFQFLVFDSIMNPSDPYNVRMANAHMMVKAKPHPRVMSLSSKVIRHVSQIEELEQKVLGLGFEGLMLRGMFGHYKHGRSTMKEGLLMKLKRFIDDEAEVIGYESLFRNENEQTRDERGYAKRSSAKAGMVSQPMLGKLICQWKGVDFSVGSGFTDAQRLELWNRRDTLIGCTVKFKYLPVGIKERPRNPVFLGLRLD